MCVCAIVRVSVLGDGGADGDAPDDEEKADEDEGDSKEVEVRGCSSSDFELLTAPSN